METDTRELEQLIVDRRRDLDRNVDALRDEARALVDWREHYRRHTGAAIAVAAAAGVMAGLMTTTRRRSDVDVAFDGPRRARNFMRAVDPHDRAVRAATEIRDGLIGALVGMAATRVVDALGRVVPGLHDHLGSGHAHESR